MTKFKHLALLFLLVAGLTGSPMGAHADGMPDSGVEGAAMPSAANINRPSSKSAAEAIEQSALIERASQADVNGAVGHYARARSLLIAAVREFDQGYAKARPDSLINSQEWRANLIDRAEDLERVLDPQPRLSERGVRFNPDSRLMGVTQKTK